MDEFEIDELEEEEVETDWSAPLDARFVVLGLSMMILGLVTVALAGDGWPKYVGTLALIASLFVMTKKQKDKLS